MSNPVQKTVFGFLKATRIPNLLIIAGTQMATAFFLLNEKVIDVRFLLLVFSTVMIAAAGYIINDYYDQKVDMINRPKSVVVGIEFSRRPALLTHVFISAMGILLGFWVDTLVGFIHIFSSSLLWYYSNYLKRLPLIGNMSIGLLSGMSILIVLVFFHSVHEIAFIYALFAFLMVFIREVLKDIEDVKGDEAFGIQTIPVIWGIRGAKIIIYLVVISGSALLLYLLISYQNLILRYYFLGLTPLFIWFIYRLIKADTMKQFRRLHLFCDTIVFTGLLSLLFH